jgi:hypothetical protein
MRNFSIKALRRFLGDTDDLWLGLRSETDIDTPFQLIPNDFLEFAKIDLASHYNHHFINAISNIKRAIDCQIDSLMIAFALSEKLKKRNFPEKCSLLRSVGLISPEILEKINRTRNLLEHEYQKPGEVEVRDAYDVAALFLDSSGKFLTNAVAEFQVMNNARDDSFRIALDYKKKVITVSDDSHVRRQALAVPKEISCSSPEYEKYLELYLGLYTVRLGP